MALTPEQQAAVDTRDKTLLVSAAAGSGKTATLTKRIIASLLDEENPADISELLIVTFTNAAVGELKERIGGAIREALKQNPGNPRLERQLLLLPSATICTIDSFCNEVLRANTGAVGIPPTYRIADAAEAELLGGAVLESLIAAAYEGDLADEIDPQSFAELCDALTRVKADGELSSTLLSLYRKCETHEDGVSSLRALCEEYDPERYEAPEKTRLGAYITESTRAMAKHYFDALQRILASFPLEGKGVTALHGLLAEEQLFLYELSTAESYAKMHALTAAFVPRRQPPIRAEEKTPAIEAAIRMRAEYKDQVLSYQKSFFLYTPEQFKDLYTNLYKYTEILCKFLEKFDFAFREEKARKGLCEYADIERYDYRCLWDGGVPSAYARELSERYSAVYIDEYQDVNRLQNLVFAAVSKPNNRFMVGDIKQSIYSFRSADPSIFAEMKNTFPPLDKAGRSHAASIFMSRNFRCDKSVVDFVNGVFDRVFGLLGESIGYVAEDRLCFSKLAPTGEQPCEITVVEPPKKGESEEAEEEESIGAVELEARAIGKKILSLLDGEKKNDGSPIRPGDIAVIFRALRSKGEVYRRVFAEMGIPSAMGEEKSLLLAPEVLLCLCLLNTIDNPHRDIYLAGLLCSPLYGFTADDLVRYRAAAPEKGKSLYRALLAYADAHAEDTRLSGFLSSLAHYRLMAEGMRVDALLTRLYAESSLLSLAAKNGGRDNLLLLKEYAVRYEAGGFSGLYSFIHYVNNLLERNTDFDAKRSAEADENAVQLITVHASKGLEYPVCFIAGCGTEMKDKSEGPFAYVEGFGLAFRLRDASGLSLVESPAFAAIARRRFERSYEEELRILYVALTRARERLYVYGTSGRGAAGELLSQIEAEIPFLDAYSLSRMHSYLKIMLAAKTEAAVHIERPTPAPREETAENAAEGESGEALPIEKNADAVPVLADPEAVERLVSRFSYTYAYAPFDEIPRKLSVSALKPTLLDAPLAKEEEVDVGALLTAAEPPESSEEGKAPLLPAFITGRKEEESARRGIATHLFLQFCDFAALRSRGARAELLRLTEEKFLSAEQAERVRLDEIEKFAESRLLDGILSARALHREMRFHAEMPATLFTRDEKKAKALGDHRILVQGVIDCLFEDENGDLVLIDYKTDRLPREALADTALAEKILSEKHGEQLSYYAIAVEEMFGKRPKHIRIYSLHLGGCVDVHPQL